MMRMRSSPREIPAATSESALLPVGALISAAATAAGVLLAELLVPPGTHTALAICGTLAVLAVGLAAAQAARRSRTAARLARRLAGLEATYGRRLALQEAETGRLATEVLPESIARLQAGDSVEEVLDATAHEPELGAAFVKAHEALVRSVLEAVKAEEDLRDSAQRAFVNVARRVQAIVHQQFQDLREMEERHGGAPEVFDDLLHLDHGTALIGRLADSLAVLGGSRPGRQWPGPVPLFNILRGAMSRITDYQRVELHSVVEVAVYGPAVEPLIHALAELLDNATRYSPPHTRVHLTAVEVQSGIAVEVEDGGVGLSEEGRTRAERVLAQISSGLDLAGLGETPRLGLAVVGRLAQANHFQVSLRPSAYAGVRAVLTVPRDLVTAVPVGAAPGAHSTAPARAASTLSVPPSQPAVIEVNGDGLPQRRRSAPVPQPGGLPGAESLLNGSGSYPVSAPAPAAAAAPPVPAPPAAAPPPGLWLAAFQDAVSGDPEGAKTAPRRPDRDEPSSKEGLQP
jgi:signal transduction histidine kinase